MKKTQTTRKEKERPVQQTETQACLCVNSATQQKSCLCGNRQFDRNKSKTKQIVWDFYPFKLLCFQNEFWYQIVLSRSGSCQKSQEKYYFSFFWF